VARRGSDGEGSDSASAAAHRDADTGLGSTMARQGTISSASDAAVRLGTARTVTWSGRTTFTLSTSATRRRRDEGGLLLPRDPGTVNGEKQKYTARAQNIFHRRPGPPLLLRRPSRLLESIRHDIPVHIRAGGDRRIPNESLAASRCAANWPAGQGYDTDFAHGTTGNWPQCGEIGIMEQWGQQVVALLFELFRRVQRHQPEVHLSNATTLSSDSTCMRSSGIRTTWSSSSMARKWPRSDFDKTSPFIPDVLHHPRGRHRGAPWWHHRRRGRLPLKTWALHYLRVYSQQ